MKTLRNLWVVGLLWLLIGGLPLTPAQAQDEGTTGVGTAMAVPGPDGAPVGSITITDVIDPFPDYNPDYPPEAGIRYVMVNVVFDADVFFAVVACRLHLVRSRLGQSSKTCF